MPFVFQPSDPVHQRALRVIEHTHIALHTPMQLDTIAKLLGGIVNRIQIVQQPPIADRAALGHRLEALLVVTIEADSEFVQFIELGQPQYGIALWNDEVGSKNDNRPPWDAALEIPFFHHMFIHEQIAGDGSQAETIVTHLRRLFHDIEEKLICHGVFGLDFLLYAQNAQARLQRLEVSMYRNCRGCGKKTLPRARFKPISA